MDKTPLKKELLIHAGYPRCASSFLQDRIFNNFKKIYYVNEGIKFRSEMNNFCYQVEYDIDLQKKYSPLFFPGNTCRSFVSEEQLVGGLFSGCVNSAMILDKLERLECDIKVLVIVRNQIEILDSSYRQYIKMGGTYSIEKFFDTELSKRNFISLDCFKYYSTIEQFEKRFGKQNILVIGYKEMTNNFPKFIDKVSAFYDVEVGDFAGFNFKTKVNKSLNNRSLKMLRFFNKFVRSFFHPNQFIIPSGIISSKSLYKLFTYFSKKNKTKLISTKQEEFLSNYFRDDNEKLYKKYKIDLG